MRTDNNSIHIEADLPVLRARLAATRRVIRRLERGGIPAMQTLPQARERERDIRAQVAVLTGKDGAR